MTQQELVPTFPAHVPAIYTENIPLQLKQGYQWHRPENQQEFIDSIEGLCLSLKYNFDTQAILYRDAAIDCYHKDRADHTYDLVEDAFKYRGDYYDLGKSPDPKGFEKEIDHSEWDNLRKGYIHKYIKYIPVREYSDKITINGLRGLALLEQHGITPDALWVGIYYEDLPTKDPWLCPSFGRWVISIAQWD